MNSLEKFLNSSLLESLCDERLDEFETLLIKNFKEKEMVSCDIDPEQELIDILVENIRDKEKYSEIKAKFNVFENMMFEDMNTSIKRAYKLGFMDGYNFKYEINNLAEDMLNGKGIK